MANIPTSFSKIALRSYPAYLLFNYSLTTGIFSSPINYGDYDWYRRFRSSLPRDRSPNKGASFSELQVQSVVARCPMTMQKPINMYKREGHDTSSSVNANLYVSKVDRAFGALSMRQRLENGATIEYSIGRLPKRKEKPSFISFLATTDTETYVSSSSFDEKRARSINVTRRDDGITFKRERGASSKPISVRSISKKFPVVRIRSMQPADEESSSCILVCSNVRVRITVYVNRAKRPIESLGIARTD